jgi:hypothetical protein
MTKEEIIKQFPNSLIKNNPLKNCPQCQGNGVFINKLKSTKPCLCVHLGGEDDECPDEG